ncbi:hypothetical protein QVD17_21953 [Tagetes erecta]|uniref:Uncharacterized protein n=1 Tax=Tagetes erecta TaxID=13708 RepID=A0AAD8NTA9_TARER|nr:hypothetical protein QVD17_21953 [Tagetes erecta]
MNETLLEQCKLSSSMLTVNTKEHVFMMINSITPHEARRCDSDEGKALRRGEAAQARAGELAFEASNSASTMADWQPQGEVEFCERKIGMRKLEFCDRKVGKLGLRIWV